MSYELLLVGKYVTGVLCARDVLCLVVAVR